jgi:2Fe-2S ferredoxin
MAKRLGSQLTSLVRAFASRRVFGHGLPGNPQSGSREIIEVGNLKVTMTDVNGITKTFDNVEEGTSLMELGKQNDVAGIMGDCGGGCACATCHVYVNAEWFEKVGEPDDIEFAMLDMVSDVQRDTSRLGCQIKMKPELDGIEVTVAPSSSY